MVLYNSYYGEFYEQILFNAEDFEAFVDINGATRYRQTVYFDVGIIDDKVPEETESFIIGIEAYEGYDDEGSCISVPEIEVTIIDDDFVGVTVEPTAISVAEGAMSTYTVVLDTQPAGDVTVAIGGVAGADLTLDRMTLIFTDQDWDTPQTVTVTSEQDIADGVDLEVTVTHTVRSTADGDYDGLRADSVAVTVTDDDSVGVTISETSLDIEEGDSAAYTVVLDSEPTGSVTVTVNAPVNTDVTAEPTSLTFTVDDWDTPQEVTVVVAEDGDAEDADATVTHSVSGADPAYSAVSVADVAVSVTDDDKTAACPCLHLVFAADASYRILTRYGATTEIVLSDYLADGVTGITFTLSSCDEGRGDYYDSAVVEDERLVLESNTLGHIHGSNTQPETVCAITGTGGGRNQDQEFRFYTVSDRTPLSLLPGALSLVEARPSEVDIRISVPQGAQDYLRLGWREIGGQPTFRVVSGVSDGTVLTITGLEQGTEYDVRASLTTFQGFDLYRVGNSGVPLSLITDGRPDSKWIRNLASGGLGKSEPIRVMSAYRSSLSIANVRESEDVGDMVFEATLSEASDDVVTVDWTTSSDTAETPADYQAESGTLTFPAGEIAQTLTVTINNDMVDEEEEETFTVTLTNAVNAMIEDASATGTITDDDVPSVAVSFGQGSYTVAEGDTVEVTVTLSEDPERSVTIPLSTANQGGASGGDYSVAASVTFNAGDTEVDISFSAASDNVDDDGESVKLSFGSSLPTGVTKGSTDEAVVSITDDDVPSVTVSFEQDSYTVAEGSTVNIKVKLDGDPERTVTIPITATDQNGASGDDYSGVPASVTFVAGDTEETITFSATQDTVDDDVESVKLTFGSSLPTGVTKGSTDEAVVSITDDDVPSVAVSFGQDSYTVAEGSTVTIKVKLDEDPERTVTIPITATDQDGASGVDYSGVPASVTFVAGDTVDDDVESVKLTFGSSLPTGVTKGSTDEAVVSITDDDVPSVEVSFGQGSYTVDEGSAVTVKVKLDADPERTVTIPITKANQGGASGGDYSIAASVTFVPGDTEAEGDTVEVTVTLSEDPERSVTIPLSTANQGGASDSDYSGVPPSVAFASGQTEKTFTFSAAEDNLEDSSESVKLSFVTLPDRVTTETTDEATVRISNKVAQNSLTVTFEFSDQMLSEGGTATVKVRLNIAPGSDVTIPLTKTEQGGASSADYSGVPANVKFASSETEKSFTFTAAQDTVDDDDESVKLGFGTLPLGVSAGSTAETTMFIADDDVPSVAVSFEQGSYTVDEGSTVTVKVKLDADPERTVTIPITKANQGGASGGDYSGVPASVTFVPGDTEVDISFSAASDGENDDGESVKLTFGNTLPTGVSAGTTNEATVTITDDDVPSVTVSFEQATYVVAEGSSVTAKVTLNMDPERTVTFPITKTNQDGATDSDCTIIPSSVTFNGGDTEKTFIFEATSDDENDDGESVKLGFGPLPTDVSAGTTNETVVTITDDDLPWVTVSFEQGSYTVTEGDTVEVTVTLSEDPERSVTIPLSTANQGGASDSGYSGVPANVTFNSGDTEVDISFSAASDNVDDDGESVKLTFGSSLPTGVTAGTTNEATNMNGDSDSDYSGIPSMLTFERGETEKRFTFFAEPDNESDDGETVMVSFAALPAMVQKGDPSEATMKLRDNGSPSEDGITCIDNNRANIATVLSARGEISSPGEIDSLVIPDVDPYRTYFVEILGADSNVDIWGQNVGGGSLTLADPHPVSLFHEEWEGTSGTSGFNKGSADGGTDHNARFIFIFSGFGDYVLRVESGDENGAGSYHVLVRYSNYCILRADGSILFPYEGGPEGYAFDVRDDTDTKYHAYDQDRGPSYYASGGNVLGDNWDSGPDEDWIRLDLKADTEYKFYLEADSDVPVTHQLTRPRIVGIYDTDGDEVHEGAAGSGTDTSVSLTFQPTSTGRYYLAVGSNPGDRTGLYSFYVRHTVSNTI